MENSKENTNIDELQNDDEKNDSSSDNEVNGKFQNFFKEGNLNVKIGFLLTSIALFLVLFFGIINGISLWIILRNMLIWGILFFALGYVLGIVLKKWIPELVGFEGSDIKDETNSSTFDYLIGKDDELKGFKDEDKTLPVEQSSQEIPKKHNLAEDFATKNPEVMAKAMKTWLHEE